MNRYDEKVYRVPKRKDGPTLTEQKSQLVRLKQDLSQFQARQAGNAVVGSLQVRIRELEASIAQLEGTRSAERQSGRPDSGDDGADGPGYSTPGNEMRATSGRFPPRGRPGRNF